MAAAGMAAPTAAVTAGANTIVGTVAQQFNPNQIMQIPSHTFRYLYDVRARHGNAAMIEAAIPMIGGAAVGYLATHNAKAAEEAGLTAADFAGAETAAAPTEAAAAGTEAKAAETTFATRPLQGQTAKAIASGVTRAVTAPVTLPIRAVSQVATSPTILGGEAAGMVSGHIIHPDSWQRTANATTWRLPDGKIGPTFGRAVAGAVGLKPGAAAFNALSGTLDAFMFAAVPDPAGAAGRVYGKAVSAEGFGSSFLGRHWGGTGPITADGVEAAATQYPSTGRAMEDLAHKTAGEIAADPNYALLAHPDPNSDYNLLGRLGAAKTKQEAIDVFKEAADTQAIVTTSRLPQLGRYGRPGPRGARSPPSSATPPPRSTWTPPSSVARCSTWVRRTQPLPSSTCCDQPG